LDFENTIEAALLELLDRFSVRQIHFDPWQMASVSQRLERAGLPMTEFPQSVPRLTEAGQNLYELIKGRGLIAYRDEGFRRAISQSVAIESTRGWRIGKATGSHKVDLTVALAMACLAAVREGPSVEITADMLGTCGESAMAQVAERAKFEGNREAMMWSEPIEKPWERDSRNAAIPRPIIIC
jgi:phage terminase large subunit-like protein